MAKRRKYTQKHKLTLFYIIRMAMKNKTYKNKVDKVM